MAFLGHLFIYYCTNIAEEFPKKSVKNIFCIFFFQGHRFNEETGLWKYPSLSPHPPADDGSLLLQQSMQFRETFNDRMFGRDDDGFLRTVEGDFHELFPPEVSDSCKCGVS